MDNCRQQEKKPSCRYHGVGLGLLTEDGFVSFGAFDVSPIIIDCRRVEAWWKLEFGLTCTVDSREFVSEQACKGLHGVCREMQARLRSEIQRFEHIPSHALVGSHIAYDLFQSIANTLAQ